MAKLSKISSNYIIDGTRVGPLSCCNDHRLLGFTPTISTFSATTDLLFFCSYGFLKRLISSATAKTADAAALLRFTSRSPLTQPLTTA